LPDQCQTASYASVFGGECRFSLFYNTGGGLVLHGVKWSKKRFLRYITREWPPGFGRGGQKSVRRRGVGTILTLRGRTFYESRPMH